MPSPLYGFIYPKEMLIKTQTYDNIKNYPNHPDPSLHCGSTSTVKTNNESQGQQYLDDDSPCIDLGDRNVGTYNDFLLEITKSRNA